MKLYKGTMGKWLHPIATTKFSCGCINSAYGFSSRMLEKKDVYVFLILLGKFTLKSEAQEKISSDKGCEKGVP